MNFLSVLCISMVKYCNQHQSKVKPFNTMNNKYYETTKTYTIIFRLDKILNMYIYILLKKLYDQYVSINANTNLYLFLYHTRRIASSMAISTRGTTNAAISPAAKPTTCQNVMLEK